MRCSLTRYLSSRPRGAVQVSDAREARLTARWIGVVGDARLGNSRDPSWVSALEDLLVDLGQCARRACKPP